MAADDGSECSRGVDPRAYVFTALMVLIGSSTAPSAKFAVRELPAGLLPLIRFGVAGLCLLPLVWRREGLHGLRKMVREDWARLALAALFCIPINQTFFLNGARLAPTSHTALIYAACPLVVLLLASAVGQERMAAGRLAGILASVAGVAVIGLDSFWNGGATGGSTLMGDLLLVGAVLSWGAYLTACKPLIDRHGPLNALVGVFLVGTLLHLPVALATMPDWPPLSGASAAAWKGLAFLTLVATVVGFIFQNLAMQRLDASQVATFNNAGPVLTIAWGVWLFGETVTPALALGGLLTLGGIIWANKPGRMGEPEEVAVPTLTPRASTSDPRRWVEAS
jgi:drug/metabolite transporter (DMT)-like permease